MKNIKASILAHPLLAAIQLLIIASSIIKFIYPSIDTGLLIEASVLGVLITGAAVQTTFSGQSQCDEYIVIGGVDTANALSGITVEIDGTPFINIANSAPLVGAYMKWMMETVGAGVVGLMFKVSTGMVKRNTTYRFTNNGVTTPTIRVFSDSRGGVPFIATTKSINISSFEDFSKFSALFITLPANIASVEISFVDGHKATMTAEEVDGLFALNNQSEALGRLNACSVIDNTKQDITNVRIFAAATALTVLIVKLPNEAFEALK